MKMEFEKVHINITQNTKRKENKNVSETVRRMRRQEERRNELNIQRVLLLQNRIFHEATTNLTLHTIVPL